MDIIVQVEAESADTAQALTRKLCLDLNRQAGVAATLVQAPPAPGAKGTIEQLFLPGQALFGTVITPGAGAVAGGVALAALTVDLFKSYFERLPKLRLTFRRADGETVTLTRESLDPDHLSATAVQLRELYDQP